MCKYRKKTTCRNSKINIDNFYKLHVDQSLANYVTIIKLQAIIDYFLI